MIVKLKSSEKKLSLIPAFSQNFCFTIQQSQVRHPLIISNFCTFVQVFCLFYLSLTEYLRTSLTETFVCLTPILLQERRFTCNKRIAFRSHDEALFAEDSTLWMLQIHQVFSWTVKKESGSISSSMLPLHCYTKIEWSFHYSVWICTNYISAKIGASSRNKGLNGGRMIAV